MASYSDINIEKTENINHMKTCLRLVEYSGRESFLKKCFDRGFIKAIWFYSIQERRDQNSQIEGIFSKFDEFRVVPEQVTVITQIRYFIRVSLA